MNTSLTKTNDNLMENEIFQQILSELGQLRSDLDVVNALREESETNVLRQSRFWEMSPDERAFREILLREIEERLTSTREDESILTRTVRANGAMYNRLGEAILLAENRASDAPEAPFITRILICREYFTITRRWQRSVENVLS